MKHLREYAEYLICFLLLAIVFGGTLFLNQNQPPLDTRTYAETLFDNSRVHKIEIFINDADKTRLWENAIYKPKLHVNVSVDGEMLSNVSFSTHGNATLANNFELNNYGVYSYKIIFNYFNEAQTYRGLDKLILKYPIEDISWIREAMTTAIFQAADVPVSLTSYAEVFINGESQGLRILQEEVSSSFQARNNLSQNSAIFKPEAINVDRDRYIKYQARLPEGQLNTLDQEKLPSFGGGAELIFHGNQSSDYPDIFENAIKKYSPAEEVLVINAIKALCESKSVSDYWNLTEIANYFAAQNLIFDMDGYTGAIAHNYYLVINNGKLELYPWDNGHSAKNDWLNAWPNLAERFTSWPIDELLQPELPTSYRPLWQTIVSSAETLAKYHGAFDNILKNTSNLFTVREELMRQYTMIRPYFDRTSASAFTDSDRDAEFLSILDFLEKRANSINDQLQEKAPTTFE